MNQYRLWIFLFLIAFSGFVPDVSAQYATVAPYAILQNNTGNFGTGGAVVEREFFTDYQSYRIRQTGTITNFSLFVATNVNALSFKLTIWRKNASYNTYDRIAISEDVIAQMGNHTNSTITLTTPITGVQEGDYYGYYLTTAPAAPYTLYANPFGGKTYYQNYDINGTDLVNYSWSSAPNVASVVPILINMTSPYAVFIGDSIIAGHPAHYSFVETTATTNINSTIEHQWYNLSGHTYQNMGIGSQTTSDILARFTNDTINLHPQVVIIDGGVNDISGGVITNETILQNYHIMISNAINASITPVVLLILPWTAGTNAQNQRIDYINTQLTNEQANHTGLIIVDARCDVGINRANGTVGNCWDINASYNAGDNIHFNTAGYGVIATTIYNTMNPTVAASTNLWSVASQEVPNQWATWSSMLGVGLLIAIVAVIISALLIVNKGQMFDIMDIIVIAVVVIIIAVILTIAPQIGYSIPAPGT